MSYYLAIFLGVTLVSVTLYVFHRKGISIDLIAPTSKRERLQRCGRFFRVREGNFPASPCLMPAAFLHSLYSGARTPFSELLSFDEVIYEIFRLGKRKARRRVLHR